MAYAVAASVACSSTALFEDQAVPVKGTFIHQQDNKGQQKSRSLSAGAWASRSGESRLFRHGEAVPATIARGRGAHVVAVSRTPSPSWGDRYIDQASPQRCRSPPRSPPVTTEVQRASSFTGHQVVQDDFDQTSFSSVINFQFLAPDPSCCWGQLWPAFPNAWAGDLPAAQQQEQQQQQRDPKRRQETFSDRARRLASTELRWEDLREAREIMRLLDEGSVLQAFAWLNEAGMIARLARRGWGTNLVQWLMDELERPGHVSELAAVTGAFSGRVFSDAQHMQANYTVQAAIDRATDAVLLDFFHELANGDADRNLLRLAKHECGCRVVRKLLVRLENRGLGEAIEAAGDTLFGNDDDVVELLRSDYGQFAVDEWLQLHGRSTAFVKGVMLRRMVDLVQHPNGRMIVCNAVLPRRDGELVQALVVASNDRNLFGRQPNDKVGEKLKYIVHIQRAINENRVTAQLQAQFEQIITQCANSRDVKVNALKKISDKLRR